MIYSIQCSGQMCNRIMWFVHALATAIDCKSDITNFFGRDLRAFSDLYPESLPEINVRCFNLKYFLPIDVLHGWLLRVPIFSEKYYLSQCPFRCARWREHGIRRPLLLWNWYFRNYEAVDRHREKIVDYLRVRDEFTVRPNKIIAVARKDAAVLVGVHIRRGDYKQACAQWYFDDSTYLQFMRDFQLSIQGPVKFILVSNEPIDVEFFIRSGVDVVDASGKAQEDIVTLSLCDYIMGPPSTFSWWAAYYGGKPRLPLGEKDMKVAAEFFQAGAVYKMNPPKKDESGLT